MENGGDSKLKSHECIELSVIRMSGKRLRNTKGMIGISTLIKRLAWVRAQCRISSIITCCLRGTSELGVVNKTVGSSEANKLASCCPTEQ